ncbi:FUSC family protein [Actinoallomurus sp. NBC_01490]|uniref:FUSC family protein n=1 Tax=Actinoallomurus sp. NBC_01490 TaxID=2903557 RepID=UPI002E366FFD|nr:FUSC family protein [Actinoallomurus sp. NBC_01490]
MTSGWTGRAGQRARTTIDRMVAADPGLSRWHLAWRATLAVACVAFAEHWVGPAAGLPALVAMLLGGMIAMNGSFLLAGRTRLDALLTAAGMPFVAFAGVVVAVAVDGHLLASRLGFVVLTVVAVYVRRFGIRGMNYGLLGWFAYMFGTFSRVRPDQLLPLCLVFLSAVAILVILMAGLAYQRPQTRLGAALRAFDLRVAAVARACADLLTEPGAKNARELHARRFYVLEAALIAEGHLASPAAVEHDHAYRLRTRLLATELAVEELATATIALAGSAGLPEPVLSAATATLRALAVRDLDRAREHARELDGRGLHQSEGLPLASLADAADRLCDALRPHTGPRHATDDGPPTPAFEPGVQLIAGNLPGSLGTAAEALEAGGVRGPRWLRLSLNSRQCVQAGLASLLTLLCALPVSSVRFYWAMLACLIVLTGTATSGETLVKGAHRVLGTALGVVTAIAAVHLTRGHDTLVVTVMAVCVFLAVYFIRVAYGVLAFTITTLMGLLYNALGEFSDTLILTRLEETAVGAGVAALIAVLILPVHNRNTTAAARDAFVRDLVSLVKEVRDKTAGRGCGTDLLMSARRLDARMHQLALATHPWGGASLAGIDSAPVARRLASYSAITVRAKALATAAAMETSPVPDLDLIAPLTMPLRRLTGDYTLRIDTPYTPMRRPPAPVPRCGPARTLRALADDLAGAMDGLRAGGDMTTWIPTRQTPVSGHHRP